jgi:hypothetical protein
VHKYDGKGPASHAFVKDRVLHEYKMAPVYDKMFYKMPALICAKNTPVHEVRWERRELFYPSIKCTRRQRCDWIDINKNTITA